eukprot:14202581-Ditylum_brightwellii.AAC.1
MHDDMYNDMYPHGGDDIDNTIRDTPESIDFVFILDKKINAMKVKDLQEELKKYDMVKKELTLN